MKTTSDDFLTLDRARLGAVVAKRARTWLVTGPLLAGTLLAASLCLVHPSYTATVSIAVQQPSGVSPLSLLSGGAPSKRYLGILKSRWAAEQVERRVHLQQLYGLPSHELALKRLRACIKPDDNTAEGLLYIKATLPAPPFAFPAARRLAVQQMSARVADAYADALQVYYAQNDNNKDAVLLRGADEQLHRAQSDYDDSFRRLNAGLTGMMRQDPRAAALSEGGASALSGPGAAGGAGAQPGGHLGGPSADAAGLEALYAQLTQVNLALQSGSAEQAAQQRLLAQQLHDPMSLPSEDPLLTSARGHVALDQNRLADLATQFGPDNPQLVLAHSQLQIDQAALQKQVSGIARDLTTPQVETLAKVQGLRAEQASLMTQISAAQRRMPVRSALSGEVTRLQADLTIRFEVLKTTMAEVAKVRLENTSAKSQITVVDSASVPDEAEPGVPVLAALCVLAALILLAVPAGREYLALGRRTAPPVRARRAARRYGYHRPPAEELTGPAREVTAEREHAA